MVLANEPPFGQEETASMTACGAKVKRAGTRGA
jgi:hypothetical protein